MTSSDDLDTLHHRAYVGGGGRVTDLVSVSGKVGYLWSSGVRDGRESVLWELGVTHDINKATRHGVRIGQDFFENQLTPDTLVSEYAQYFIHHRVSRALSAMAYVQWSDDEFISGSLRGGSFEREIYGGYLSYQPDRGVGVAAGLLYEDRTNTATGVSTDREVYYTTLRTPVFDRSTLYFRYQYEDASAFDETLYMTGIRRPF